MEMRKKIKLVVIFSIILIMMAGFFIYKTFAASYIEGQLVGDSEVWNEPFWTQVKPGDTITNRLAADTDWRSRWWLCMQHQNVNSLSGSYLVRAILNVDANVSSYGNYKSEINSGDGTGTTAAVDETTKKLAYLIYAATQDFSTGYPDNGTASKKQLFTFLSTVNMKPYIGDYADKITYNNSYYQATIDSYSKTYSNSYSTGSSATITEKSDSGAKVTVKNIDGNTYSYLGPFKMKTQGSISGVSINDGGRGVSVAGYSNSPGGTISGISGINRNGNPFYIVANGTLTSLNPTVTISTSGAAGGGTVTNPTTGSTSTGYIRARIVFIAANDGQATAIFRGELQPTSPSSDSETFTAKNDLGKITVIKTGAYTGDTEYEKVTNFAFKIYRLDGTTKKYLRVNDKDEIKDQAVVSINSAVSYNEGENTATTFHTFNGGTVSIDNISTEYQYYIEEIETDETNYDIDIIEAEIQYENGGRIFEDPGDIDIGPIPVELKGDSSSGPKVTVVSITDYRKTGKLTIEKVDSDTYDTKLGGVKFIVRNTDTNKYVMARMTSEGQYVISDRLGSYTESIDLATIFETNSNTGKIIIEGLDVGNYEITEIENPNYGYVISSEGEEAVTTTVVKADDSANEIIRNEKHTGNLEILKQDADTGKVMENVGFIIKRANGTGNANEDYVVAMEYMTSTGGNQELRAIDTLIGTKYLDGMTITQNRDEATVFRTDNRGLIQIYNMLEGEYIVEEVDVGDNNYGYDIDDSYISWDVNGQVIEGRSATVTIERQRSYNTVRLSTVIEDDQKIFEDGIYRIQNLDGERAIDLYYENQSEGAPIVWHPVQNIGKNPAQEFYLKYAGDGYYYIISSSSGKYLTTNGNEIVASSRDDSKKQKWYIKEEGRGFVITTGKNSRVNMTGMHVPNSQDYEYKMVLTERSFVYNDSQMFTFESLTEQSTSGTIEMATANNRRKYIKLNGYVWEDITWEEGKVFDGNGLYQAIADDINDKMLENITVRLKDRNGNIIPFKDVNGNMVNETQTNSDGKYTMEDVLIDSLDDYYIEFSYNGMAYESVEIKDNNISNPRGTDAIEGESVRQQYNEDFAQITVGQSNNSNGQKTNDIRYNQGEYSSSINYEGNYLYGYSDDVANEIARFTGITAEDYRTYYPVNGVADKYLITSSTYEAYTSVGQSGYLSDIINPDDIRKNGITEIGATFDEGINLGLTKRERPDLSVVKDLDRATVNMAGTQHVYLYGDRFNSDLWADNSNGVSGHELDPRVKFEEKYAEMTYTRPLYASDIYYNGDGEQLEVKVTYKISIRNNSTNINARIYELDDYFDSKYNVIGVGTDIKADGSIRQGTELDYTEPTDVNDEYKKITIGGNNQVIAEMGALEESFIYVQLDVNREDIIEIIETEGNDDYRKLDNISEIRKYGITKTNASGQEEVYAGIDKDSQPGNTNPSDRSTWEDDTDKAPGLLLVLQEEREVNGKVFVDTDENPVDGDKGVEVHTGVARQGNGQLDEDEKGIKNVKVTLVDEDGNIADVYNEETGAYEEAVTYTNENGDYTLGGFIPGHYQVQYTWGGNIDGEGIDSTYVLNNGEEQIVNVQNYKSTIVNENVWSAKETADKWYNDSFKQGYPNVEWNTGTNTEIRTSDAVDDYETRLAIDSETSEMTYSEKQKFENTYNGSSTGEKYTNTQMTSNTNDFRVYIEYVDTENIDNNITDQNYSTKNTISSIDFGVIERAKQVLQLEKHINEAKITLADGNILIDAKLVDGQLVNQTQHVTVLPPSPAANGQVNIEIDNELIQGATLEVQYGLQVTNISELEYQTQEFYMYGIGHGEDISKIVTLQPALIIDYLDDSLVIDMSDNAAWQAISRENRNSQLIDSGLLSESLRDTLSSTAMIITTDEMENEVLVPEGLEGTVANSQSRAEITLKSYKLLANNGDETFSENHAEIIRVIKNNGGSILITTPGNYVPSDSSTSEVDDSTSESLVIIPPTGLETNTISYVIIAISSLAIITAGVILIKKFVLK